MLTEALNCHLPEKHRKRKNNKNWTDNEVKNLATENVVLRNWQMQLEVHKSTEIFKKLVKTLNRSSNLKNKHFIKIYLKPI